MMGRTRKVDKATMSDATTSPRETSPQVVEVAIQPSEQVAPAKSGKRGKVKLIKERFKFPKQVYARFAQLKKRALEAGYPAKKSELVRAGLFVLDSMSPKDFVANLKKADLVKPDKRT